MTGTLPAEVGGISYTAFLASKQPRAIPHGRPCTPEQVNPILHPWQQKITAWAVHTGRAALWEWIGLGKTFQQLEWARLSGDRTLIIAPLAVCEQTSDEARKLGLAARYVRSDDAAAGPGIWITNYEMALRFDPTRLDGVVLDEASILKAHDGKTRTALIRHFRPVPHRLTATATPAPNDSEELTNQAEFLGVMSRVEMLAAYFVHDDEGWRIKGHAKIPMFQWMATWAIALRTPSDLGYPDDGYRLPGHRIIPHLLPVEVAHSNGQLFATPATLGGVGGRASVRKATVIPRCQRAASLIAAEPDEPWLLWCDRNDEARTLAELIPGSVNVEGSMNPDAKACAFRDFAHGKIRYLITKPSIGGLGMNWQHCARMAFIGLSDSYEKYRQGIGRCDRYGQTRCVDVHVILSEAEAPIADNIARKQRDADHRADQLIAEMRNTTTWRAP